MNQNIQPEVTITVPLNLLPLIEELTSVCAAELGETVEQTRRAVEIAILQCGIVAVRRNARANREFASRMGWPWDEAGA